MVTKNVDQLGEIWTNQEVTKEEGGGAVWKLVWTQGKENFWIGIGSRPKLRWSWGMGKGYFKDTWVLPHRFGQFPEPKAPGQPLIRESLFLGT